MNGSVMGEDGGGPSVSTVNLEGERREKVEKELKED
jgi:hypothetical protein